MNRDRYAIVAAAVLLCLLAAVTLLPLAAGVLFAAPGLVLAAGIVWWLWRRSQSPRR